MLPDTMTGPTDADLAEIDVEWPQIVEDLEVLDAEILALTLHRNIDELAVRRVRRAARLTLTTSARRVSGEAA